MSDEWLSPPTKVCTCEWADMEKVDVDGEMLGGKFMSKRDEECEVHGDGTPSWTKIQKRAHELAEQYNIPRPCDKGE